MYILKINRRKQAEKSILENRLLIVKSSNIVKKLKEYYEKNFKSKSSKTKLTIIKIKHFFYFKNKIFQYIDITFMS